MKSTFCTNGTNLPENNQKIVVRSLLHMDHPTRTALARQLGLSQSAITKIISHLIQINLIREYNCIDTVRGRKPIELAVNSSGAAILAVRINRNYIQGILCAIDGTVHARSNIEISARDGITSAMEALKKLIENHLSNPNLPVLGIGIALPGPLDVNKARIAMMTGFPGWSDVNIKKELEALFCLPVFLDHDTNCGARAETWYGQSKACKNLLYILCDRGIGAGIILGDTIYSNPRGFTGEFGHISINCFGPPCECGNFGCLELYASTVALEREYQKELFQTDQQQPMAVDARQICCLVRDGDAVAVRVFARVCKYLAFGTVSLINLLCPETIVFDDLITEGGSLFLEIITHTLKKHLLPNVFDNLQIKVSSLNKDAVLLGAGALAFEQLLDNPELMEIHN